MHILVTRPETEALKTKRKLETMGHRVSLAPMLVIAHDLPALDLRGVQAIVLTSRNSVRALADRPDRTALLEIPVISVGKGTGTAARECGFNVAWEGDAGGAELAGRIASALDPRTGCLLHVSGDTIAFDLEKALAPSGFDIRRAVVYRSLPATTLPPEVDAALRHGNLDAVLLMSPRTAGTWVELVEAAGLKAEASRLAHLCLSPGVAARLLDLAPPVIHVARQPNEEEMLALVARLSSSSADSS
jgi:uroporphyrinogen-III synthase